MLLLPAPFVPASTRMRGRGSATPAGNFDRRLAERGRFRGEPFSAGTVTISVTEAGTIAWNKDFISLAEFIDRLKTFKVSEPDGRILINGDEGAQFNAALYVFDEARKTGFQKIFIETKVRQVDR